MFVPPTVVWQSDRRGDEELRQTIWQQVNTCGPSPTVGTNILIDQHAERITDADRNSLADNLIKNTFADSDAC